MRRKGASGRSRDDYLTINVEIEIRERSEGRETVHSGASFMWEV